MSEGNISSWIIVTLKATSPLKIAVQLSALAPLSTLVFGDSIPQITKGELGGYVVSSHKYSAHIHMLSLPGLVPN